MPEFSTKRGSCNNGKTGDLSGKKITWFYNYRTSRQPNYPDATYDMDPDWATFIPMVHDVFQAQDIARGEFKDNKGKIIANPFFEFPNGLDELLGFNEPDNSINNVSPDVALQTWPILENINPRRLGSPVCQRQTIDAWLPPFMTGTIAYQPRVDFVVLHWYQRSPWAFLAFVDTWYQRYGKPIWITEFSITNWGFANPAVPAITEEETKQFILIALTGLEARTFVERYSWYSNPCDPSVGEQASLWTKVDAVCADSVHSEELNSNGVVYYNITHSQPPTMQPSSKPSKNPAPIRTKSTDGNGGSAGLSVDGIIALTVILGVAFLALIGFFIYYMRNIATKGAASRASGGNIAFGSVDPSATRAV